MLMLILIVSAQPERRGDLQLYHSRIGQQALWLHLMQMLDLFARVRSFGAHLLVPSCAFGDPRCSAAWEPNRTDAVSKLAAV